jgi:hypothetical protein
MEWGTDLSRCRWDSETLARLADVHGSIEWMHGQEWVSCGREDFVVLCVVRNGEPWVSSFIEHYSRLGARHFFFLDNGSTDETPVMLAKVANATVLRSSLPYSQRFHDFTRYLMMRFGAGKWALMADIDELFDFPGSDRKDMGELLGYLNQCGFTAVRSHLIDMFSDQPLGFARSEPSDSLREKYRYCDVSDLWGIPDPHLERNDGDGRDYPFLIGGIRKTIFGTNWIYLTKHPLLFDPPSMLIPDPHSVIGARVADFNGMFWHYKFLDSFASNAEDILRRWAGPADNIGMRSYLREVQAYVRVSGEAPSLKLMLPTSVAPMSALQFVQAGILNASKRYADFISGACLP